LKIPLSHLPIDYQYSLNLLVHARSKSHLVYFNH